MRKRILRIVIVVLLLALAISILEHYWNDPSMEEIVRVPLYIMVLAFVYVVIQILKRYFFKEQNWWDWLYYIGLLAMVIPTFFTNPEYEGFYSYLTRIGTLFLVLPVLIDSRKYVF